MPININDGMRLAAPRYLDLRQGKFVSAKSVPYSSTVEALAAIPLTRRAEGLIVYVKNGLIIEQWQFVGGIADINLVLIFDGTGSGGGVQSVTGINTDNSDPQNPVIYLSSDENTLTGDGTPVNPLQINHVFTDGTMTGLGTELSPLSVIGGGGGGIASASNGLSIDTIVNPGDVILSGTLNQATAIDAASFGISIFTNQALNPILQIDGANASQSTAFLGTLINGNVFQAATNAGYSFSGTSESGVCAYFQSLNSAAALLITNPISNNTIVPILQLNRITQTGLGEGVDGIGSAIEYFLSTASGTATLSNKLISKLLDATTGTNEFSITGNDGSNVQLDLFKVSPTAGAALPLYGVGTFTGTPAKALTVQADGKIVEADLSVGGVTDTIYTGNGTLASARTIDLDSNFLHIEQSGNPLLLIDPTVDSETTVLLAYNNTGGGNIGLITFAPNPTGTTTTIASVFNGFDIVSGISLQVDSVNSTINYNTLHNVFDGQIQATLYGSGTFTGTPTFGAAFDSTGNLIEVNAVPNLQAVTDIGFQTTNPLTSSSLILSINDGTTDTAVGVGNTTTGDNMSMYAFAGVTPEIHWNLPSLGFSTTTLKADNADGVTLQLPNSSGTLVARVNGAGASTIGNVVVDFPSVLTASAGVPFTGLHIIDGGGYLLAFNNTDFLASSTTGGLTTSISTQEIAANDGSSSRDLFLDATHISKRINTGAGINPHVAEVVAVNIADNFASDAAAAAAGVRVGEAYHNAGVVRIRLV